jgi:hypothetical protein
VLFSLPLKQILIRENSVFKKSVGATGIEPVTLTMSTRDNIAQAI